MIKNLKGIWNLSCRTPGILIDNLIENTTNLSKDCRCQTEISVAKIPRIFITLISGRTSSIFIVSLHDYKSRNTQYCWKLKRLEVIFYLNTTDFTWPDLSVLEYTFLSKRIFIPKIWKLCVLVPITCYSFHQTAVKNWMNFWKVFLVNIIYKYASSSLRK